jgi:hypothetical protein
LKERKRVGKKMEEERIRREEERERERRQDEEQRKEEQQPMRELEYGSVKAGGGRMTRRSCWS